MIDATDPGEEPSLLLLLEHSVQDARPTSTGKPHVVSEKLQFVSIGKNGAATNAGIAPHLNLRPATAAETAALADLRREDWLKQGLEKTALQFAAVTLAQAHMAEVRARRLPEIDKVEQEVRARLKKEINYWDARAIELKEQERAGKKTRLNWQNAQRRAEDLADRLQRRTQLLQQERFISSAPPQIRGGMLVIPQGLLARLCPASGDPAAFAADAAARRAIEQAAMAAVMAAERALGHEPEDVSAQKIGYDIASYDPGQDKMRFIEVKGRIAGADSVMLTRQEIITSLHAPDKYILAIVEIDSGHTGTPRYVRGALDTREPPFEQNAIQFSLKSLLERAEVLR